MLTRKNAQDFEIKLSENAGEFTARFSKFDVVDLDGDITVKTAFQEGQEVRIAQWGHNWEVIVVGKGKIRTDGTYAYVDGEFFLNTTAGKDHYETVKALGNLQQWSYGFRITAKSYKEIDGIRRRVIEGVDVFEVSPVMIAAGIDTGTDEIKNAQNVKALAEGQSYEDLYHRLTDALQSLTATPFGGSSGYVSIMETRDTSVIAQVLNIDEDWDIVGSAFYEVPYTVDGAGEVTLGDPVQVQQVWQAVKSKLVDQARAALGAVEHVRKRIADIKSLRLAEGKEGRAISSARRAQMGEISSQLREAADGLDAILQETEPTKAGPDPVLMAEFLRYQQTRSHRALSRT